MNGPTLIAPHWLVWTSEKICNEGIGTRPLWCWVAHGPRGSQSGAEESADAAVSKAAAAMYLLDEPRRNRGAA